ncbi:endonuclease domain-containing protein [Streptomyces sp. NBC_00105]|uniref:endonuclease domain-containing protein n=1 Tax=Streptomyces sp. NBC_00105 TaxID=2903622 RepID=UPI0032476B4A
MTEELVGRARICSHCRAQGPRSGAWRTPSPLGYVTLCPPCSGATFQQYTGHLHGVLYASARTRSTRADGYLCRMSAETRASVWDHCHDHGYVPGPLCASGNTYEGKSSAHSFLRDQEGSALHLLQCRGCLERRTLPARYHAALARMHLKATERHSIRSRRCRREPYVEDVELDRGAYRFELSCWWHDARCRPRVRHRTRRPLHDRGQRSEPGPTVVTEHFSWRAEQPAVRALFQQLEATGIGPGPLGLIASRRKKGWALAEEGSNEGPEWADAEPDRPGRSSAFDVQSRLHVKGRAGHGAPWHQKSGVSVPSVFQCSVAALLPVTT